MQNPSRVGRWVDGLVSGGAVLVIGAVLSEYPPEVGRYIAYWVILPIAAIVGSLAQYVVRRWLFERFERWDPQTRVMTVSGLMAAVTVWGLMVVAYMPEPPRPRRGSPGSEGATKAPALTFEFPDSKDGKEPAKKAEEDRKDGSDAANAPQQAPAPTVPPRPPAAPSGVRVVR